MACGLDRHWDLHHLDTADRRDISNLGRFELINVLLALKHGMQFLAMLLRHRPQVVYVPIAQNTLGTLRDMLFMIPALLTRRRLVIHIHGGGFGQFHATAPALVAALIRAVVGKADRIIVLGESLRGMLDGIAPSDRVAVIANGMPDPFPTPPPRDAAAGRTFRVLYLSNLVGFKGFLDLMEAVAGLVEAGHDVSLDLAGGWGGPADEAAAQSLLARLGERAHLHGAVGPEQKHELLASCDVLALPTTFDGHPFVILEAMAAGLPVISTRYGAIPETVLHEQTGLLVEQRDPAGLADAILRLAGDPRLRLRLGAAGRERFVMHYGLEPWARRLHHVLLDATRRDRAGRTTRTVTD
jgi:glycosyltransferase involved in cell wall biosynthesis